MSTDERLEQIVSLVEKRRFISVKELSHLYDVSEVTIRRDLQRLHDEKRLLRTHGGATSTFLEEGERPPVERETPPLSGFQTDRVEALIASLVDPDAERVLVDQAARRSIPIVAESVGITAPTTLVAVNSYQAGYELGGWAGRYAQQRLGGQAQVLDLTQPLNNTMARSQGFIAGLKEVLPGAQVILSLDTQGQYQTAYQLTSDALKVYPHINIIFAINDTTAWGANQACRDLGRDPAAMLLLTFGLEGNTLKDALMAGDYCKAGLAMFPEIVGPVCVAAAIQACHRRPLPEHLVTPHAVLTPETLPQFYLKRSEGWHIRWETVRERLSIPLDIEPALLPCPWPRRIGFVIPFIEHEWYKNLIVAMQAYTTRLGIELEVIDAHQNFRDEITLRKRWIAQAAAQLVQPGEVMLIDGGQVTTYLAEALAEKENITVITNSMAVFDLLRHKPNITLISTGGLLQPDSQTLIGPTAEAVLRDLRADKLFLAITGISLNFGLSHTNLAEVTMKQAMIRAAREIVLLADHTKFNQESVMQVAPLKVVNKLITDNGLPASLRLDLTKRGLEIILAER